MSQNQKIIEAKQRHMPPPHKRKQCCATCDFLSNEGMCLVYNQAPPIEYIEQENDCGEYDEAPPF